MANKFLGVKEVVNEKHVKLIFQKRWWFIDIGKPYTVDAHYIAYIWHSDHVDIDWDTDLAINIAVDLWQYEQDKKDVE